MITKKLLIVLVCMNISMSLFSQAGSYVTNLTDARSVAMGNTYIAMDNNNFVYSNLAANSLTDTKFGINVSYRPWINDLSNNYNLMGANAYVSIDTKSSLAIGFKNFDMPTTNITDENGNSTGSYNPSETSFALGYAYKFTDNTALALTLKYLESNLSDTYNASTVLFDLGFKSSYNHLNYGIIVKNLGQKLKFDDESVSVPITVGGGIAYNEDLNYKNNINMGVDFANTTTDDESGFSAGVGGEYTYDHMFSLRAGYHFSDESIGLSALSVGAGINIKGAQVNFGYLISDNAMNNNFNISCSFVIGK